MAYSQDAEIKRKAEAGIKLDVETPEKMAKYNAYQKRITDMVTQKARSGERLQVENDFKNQIYADAQKNLNPNDGAYYNPDQIMNRQNANSDARMGALEALLQKGADGQMASQEALLGQARDAQILELQKALEDAVSEGNISVREAEAQFEEQKGAIEQQAYQDAERTGLMSQERGIQNSAQAIGLMQGDNARKNSLINTNMSTRDRRVNDVRDRVKAIKNKSALDIANANANYGYGMAGAKGQIDSQMNQNLFNMGLQDYQMDREQQFGLDSAGMQNRFQQGQMAQQQKYAQDNMKMAQGFDIAKMNLQQKQQLAQMAQAFGYDLDKMSVQQQYQLANMAQSFGYDMQMQEDTQSHDSYMSSMDRTFQREMFGAEQNAKIDEYDKLLAREMASYDSSTPEGQLRMKQLESSKEALINESMTKVLGEIMGQSFIQKYGEGMSTADIEKWMSDPMNLTNLEAKVQNAPKEKKGFWSQFINSLKSGAGSGNGYRSAP